MSLMHRLFFPALLGELKINESDLGDRQMKEYHETMNRYETEYEL